ncbi:MAG TPA: hypothetical protein VFT62_01765, partial [Mycobacteriales bacterium]|nr:hypothetical protein [Mycobacteriales bacterium]
MGGRRRARGRHRDVPARHVVRRAGLAGLAAAAATVFALTGSAPAQADAPVQTGWWNALSGGGQAAPAPTTPAGGLHIAVAPGQVLAFGAVLYAMPADATATLELPITNVVMTDNVNTTGETIGGVVPVPSLSPALALRACPTKTTAWKAGDDQPMAAAPGYDCSTRSVTGNLAADGKTVTFLLDGSLETTPGQLSVAIVPVLTNAIPNLGTEAPVDTTQPFSLDVPKPGTDSLTLTGTSPGLAGGTPAGGAAGGSTGGPAAGGASPVAAAG